MWPQLVRLSLVPINSRCVCTGIDLFVVLLQSISHIYMYAVKPVLRDHPRKTKIWSLKAGGLSIRVIQTRMLDHIVATALSMR